ncbi:MAG: hypothetical protein ACXVCV_02675 [Polyangia bacterium]
MKVTSQEIDALVGVLDYYIPDLHAEIVRTAERALRERLRAQEAQLTGLRRKLIESRNQLDDDGSGHPIV